MEVHELHEAVEKSHKTGERLVGLSMAIFAILLATATMLSHRAHTEEVLEETLAADQWAYYQAKDIRSHVYDADAGLAKVLGAQGTGIAADFASQSIKQKNDAVAIEKVARDFEKDVVREGRRAAFYDASELMLEVSIVLCSISLLSLTKAYWKFSFVFAGAGAAVIVWGILLPR